MHVSRKNCSWKYSFLLTCSTKTNVFLVKALCIKTFVPPKNDHLLQIHCENKCILPKSSYSRPKRWTRLFRAEMLGMWFSRKGGYMVKIKPSNGSATKVSTKWIRGTSTTGIGSRKVSRREAARRVRDLSQPLKTRVSVSDLIDTAGNHRWTSPVEPGDTWPGSADFLWKLERIYRRRPSFTFHCLVVVPWNTWYVMLPHGPH